MILVTGAAGKTGQAVIRALAGRKSKVRAFVRSKLEADLVAGIGAESVTLGEFQDTVVLRDACKGIEKIYHICPNVAADEKEIGKNGSSNQDFKLEISEKGILQFTYSDHDIRIFPIRKDLFSKKFLLHKPVDQKRHV